MALSLENKVALVTGGNSGIGAATVELLRKQGAKVAVLDIADSSCAASSNELYIKCNVASQQEVEDAIAKVVKDLGKLDVLVNCAGVMDGMEKVGDISNKTWERCFAVNVTGPMYLTRACIPHFLAQESKGVIINVCSVASVRGPAAGVAYTASKHALLGLSRNTAWMYAKDGIRCNAVLPGGTETEIMKTSGVQMDMNGYQVLAPFHGCMPGSLKPAELANAILFLITAPSVNGAELAVDKGWLTS